MCLLKRANLPGAILTKLFFQRYGVSAVFAAICQSEQERAATGDFGRNPADGFRIEGDAKVQGLQLRAADLTGTNCFKTYFSGTDLTDTEIGGITLSKDFARLRGADNAVSGGEQWLSCWG